MKGTDYSGRTKITVKINTRKLNFIIEEIEREMLLDFMHAVEDLTGRKPAVQRLLTAEESALLDYLFKDGLYPITEDRDYRELGDLFTETE
jgi:hypothetical protein